MMTIRLEDEGKQRLGDLAVATRRSKSFLVAEAIREYSAQNARQLLDVNAALQEADAGAFASDKNVRALASKWKVNAGQVPAQPR